VGELDGRLLAGRYQLVEHIGQGGMGVVWRAFDTGLDREVAVKELRLHEWIDEGERARWYARMGREARAAARLKHPGIVTVYDRVVGEDGRPWIVMELIHGMSLADELKRHGRLPEPRVADIGLRLLEAVSVAHANGIVHRDIKPANVLFEGDRVVLTDFGIAALDGDTTLTHTGAVLGTPAYMSPEQVDGSPVPQSDLWSLGATLYDAVEGHPPFTGSTHGAVFAAIATRDPIPPVHAGRLAPVLAALLRKDPSERPSAERTRDLLAPLARPGSPERSEHIRGPAGGEGAGTRAYSEVHSANGEKEEEIRRVVRISPDASKLAAEFEVNPDSIEGTGAGGTIRRQDVIAAIKKNHGAYATRAAREVAAERGIDLAKVRGTGKDGLILVQDVRGTANAPQTSPANYSGIWVLVVVGVVVVILGLVYHQKYGHAAWDGVVTANTCVYQATKNYGIVGIKKEGWYREPCSRPWGPGTAYTVHGIASGEADDAVELCDTLTKGFPSHTFALFPGKGSGAQTGNVRTSTLILCLVPLH
jgi:serine/threonine protein kinase